MDTTPHRACLSSDQIDHMVDRFLSWKLPEHFTPDGGISFEPIGSIGTAHQFRREPVGTNLFTAAQAEQMVRHMLEGLVPASARGPAGCVIQVWLSPTCTIQSARAEFLIVETGFADFAEVCAAVDEDRLIVGDMLHTRRVAGSASAVMEITRRQPVAFRGSAVVRVQLPTPRYIEEPAVGVTVHVTGAAPPDATMLSGGIAPASL